MKNLKSKLLIISFFFLIIFFFSGNPISANTNPSKEIIVEYGDTLWGIAREHQEKGQDIRKFVFEIKKINNIRGDIYPGEMILIP